MKKLIALVLMSIAGAGICVAAGGVKKKRMPPYDYGKVVIANFSAKAGLSPVRFDHWSHRARFSCRVCHIDIGFAMQAGATQIKASDNANGYYCGTCHNGRMTVEGKKVFAACERTVTDENRGRCAVCHREGDATDRADAFYSFAEKMPRERLGNGIDWEDAEARGLIKPVTRLEGISPRASSLPIQKDFSLTAKVAGMPEIIFSHKKHTVWNGCEFCHPEIFVGVKKGMTKYSMVDIFEGKYCGVCHDKVAFPQSDCQRCHTKPVS